MKYKNIDHPKKNVNLNTDKKILLFKRVFYTFSRAACTHVAGFLVHRMQNRWYASEKSYPPRSRASKEGLRFGKSAPFPFHPFERMLTREKTSVSPSSRISLARQGKPTPTSASERRRKRKRSGSGGPATDEERRTCGRAVYVWLHEPSYKRALEWKGERMTARARERTEGHGRGSATTREGESQRQRDSEREGEREPGKEGGITPTTGRGENYPVSAWGVRPRLRDEPRTSEASAVPDIHQVPHGTRLEARTVRHTVHSTIRPMLDRRRSGPRRHQASSTRAVTRPQH